METKKNDTKALLNQCGLKATSQRLLVYDAMRRLGHASADMVEKLMGSDPVASTKIYTLATIYNTLESMAAVGILTRRPSTNNKMYFDVNTYDHCHLYDESTHSISDYDDAVLFAMVRDYLASKKLKNFIVDRIDIQLMGKAVK